MALVQVSDYGGWARVGAKEVKSRSGVDLTTPAIFTFSQLWTYSFCSNTSNTFCSNTLKCEEIFIRYLLYGERS